MQLTLGFPNDKQLRQFLGKAVGSFSYTEVGATRAEQDLPGYDNDHNRVCLGQGEAVFRDACARLARWENFPARWVRIGPDIPEIRVGQRVAMQACTLGVTWISAAELIYTIDEPRRFGFAYGTLDAHVECGEERFLVEWLADNTVWYRLDAFSRPRRWFIRLGYPLARLLQKRFVTDSFAQMQQPN